MRIAFLAVMAAALAGCGNISSSRMQTLNLTPSPIQVPALGYSAIAFASYTGDAVISGHISVFGGSGNDISAYVLADDDFVNFANRHQFRAFFSAARTSAATVNVGPLPAGSYHLVFDNRFSLLSKKTVVANLVEHFSK